MAGMLRSIAREVKNNPDLRHQALRTIAERKLRLDEVRRLDNKKG